jgi:hypothetical protein
LSRKNLKEQMKCIVGYSAEWSVGYLGLWAMKWVLTDLMFGGGTIKDAIETLFYRTDSAEGHSRFSGFFLVVKQCIEPYTNWGFYLLALGILIFFAVLFIKERKNITGGTLAQGGLMLIVAVFPFAWMFLTQNHVEQHWMFTFKILAASVFAVICAVGKGLGYGKTRSSL